MISSPSTVQPNGPSQKFSPNYRDDMTLSPFQTQQYNALILASRDDYNKAKMASLNFYQKDPILQPNETELYVK